ncbi:MAG: hypothetical protein IKP40_10925 [Clostridia bacterium]|nr:hypothetical protein [Clostridia bacterium]
MKRLVSLFLVIALLMSLTASALASTEYYSELIKGLDWEADDMTSTRSKRVTAAALVLLCYMMEHEDGVDVIDDLSLSKDCRIAKFGSLTVDIYYPTTSSGKYLNLFVSCYTGKITDYGIGRFTGSSEKTFYDVDMEDVFDRLMEIVEFLSDSD